MWAERGPFNTTEQSLFYINALKMKNGCRFHTLQFLMVLTSRDKVFGFKRKMHFWKTLCYKKENLKCFHCCWSSSEEDTSKSQVSSETTWGNCGTHWTYFLSLKTSLSMSRLSFPESSDCKKLTWKKKKRSCSPIHSRWVLLICPEKFWISVKKRISCYS